MEEHKRRVSTDFKRPRRLDLNAPLLSTRRHPGSYISRNEGKEEKPCCLSNNFQGKLQDTSDGIPFCWEQAPGKPKNRNINTDSDIDTPRLSIPPSRWHPPQEEQSSVTEDNSLDRDTDDCEADVDTTNYHDIYSDAVEVLSLTEAMDIVEKKAEKHHHDHNQNHDHDHHGLDGFNLDSQGMNGDVSPSYIIERFLPDATALAAASVLSVSGNLTRKLCNHPDACNVADRLQRSYSLTKGGCGLELLFPWRYKHNLCGVKSPVKHGCSPDLHLQTQCDVKHKGSSRLVKHFGPVKKHT